MKVSLSPTSWAISPGLYLVRHPLPSPAAAPPPKPTPIDHIVAVDVSGSMSWDLPKLARHVKARLPTLVGDDDTVTLLAFSGRGECVVIFEREQLAGIKDIARLNGAIDRHLRPIGLTGFVEPLRMVKDIAMRLVSQRSSRIALFFMSDGCDNCWRREEIISAVKDAAPFLASVTIVEYGLYADRPMLSRMAETAGGSLIYASDFSSYEPMFEAAMSKKGPPGAKKTTLTLDHMPVDGFAFAVDGKDMLTFATDLLKDGRAGISVPSHLTAVYYLSTATAPSGRIANLAEDAKLTNEDANYREQGNDGIDAAYAAMALYGQRVKPKIILSVLRALGDVRLINEFSTCFGKQRYSAFVEECIGAALDPALRFTAGYDPNKVPREDAPTILDVLDILARDERCRILTQSDGFLYSRIGRKAVSKARMLTVTEGKEVASLAEALGATREVDAIKEALAALSKIVADRKEPLRFTLDKAAADKGYHPTLVWNESQPNLSARVCRPGVVDIAGDPNIPEWVKAALPATLKTFDFKTYTFVKDGFTHIEWLPVIIPVVVYDTFVAMGVIDPVNDVATAAGDDVMVTLDLRKVPVINQKMINEASARTLAENQWRLLQLKAAAKVYKHYTPEKTSKGFATVYGKEVAAWLDENGVSDSNGYSFASTVEKGTDIYLGKALDVKIPGFSSLPTVKEVRERMDSIAAAEALGKAAQKPKKLTPAAALMAETLREVDEFLASSLYKKAAKPDALFEQWVNDQAKAAVDETRKLQTEMAKTKWACTVGGSWLREFSSLDDTQLTLTLGGESRTVTFDLDTEVKIAI